MIELLVLTGIRRWIALGGSCSASGDGEASFFDMDFPTGLRSVEPFELAGGDKDSLTRAVVPLPLAFSLVDFAVGLEGKT